MAEMTASSRQPRRGGAESFTLIELLLTMAIIAILMGLTFAAVTALYSRASRSRASSEIQAMSAALEGYKTDNGIYPPSDGSLLLTNTPYANFDGTSVNYQTNSQILYQALSGQTNFSDVHAAGVKTYMNFKANQLGNLNSTGAWGAGSTYVQDPWTYSYAYSTGPSVSTVGATNSPYNGPGFFDLWSTGGLLAAKVNTNAWISNWQ